MVVSLPQIRIAPSRMQLCDVCSKVAVDIHFCFDKPAIIFKINHGISCFGLIAYIIASHSFNLCQATKMSFLIYSHLSIHLFTFT